MMASRAVAGANVFRASASLCAWTQSTRGRRRGENASRAASTVGDVSSNSAKIVASSTAMQPPWPIIGELA
jgi:hypothetical protein